MPSIVVISPPVCITASVMQERIRRPLMCTVQAPHSPRSQPFFVPVNWRRLRSASSSVTRGSTVTECGCPLTVSVMFTAPGKTAEDL